MIDASEVKHKKLIYKPKFILIKIQNIRENRNEILIAATTKESECTAVVRANVSLR